MPLFPPWREVLPLPSELSYTTRGTGLGKHLFQGLHGSILDRALTTHWAIQFTVIALPGICPDSQAEHSKLDCPCLPPTPPKHFLVGVVRCLWLACALAFDSDPAKEKEVGGTRDHETSSVTNTQTLGTQARGQEKH